MQQPALPSVRRIPISCAFLLTLPAVLPGCVAWEIRDEMRTANDHLCQIKPAMALTLQSVERVSTQIDRASAQLAELHATVAQTRAQLAIVERSLTRADERLVGVTGSLEQTQPKLSDAHAALKDVHKSLAPLSDVLGSLGKTMSLFGLSDQLAADPQPEPAPALSNPEVAAADTAAARPAPATKGQDPVLGTWIVVSPPPAPPLRIGRVYVFADDGRFLTSEGASPPASGRWARQGRTLTLTHDASSANTPVTESLELLSLTSRSLTVRAGDTIRVHTRP